MTDLIPRDDIPDDEPGLLAYLFDLVERAARTASVQVNATLTLRNWLIGRAIRLNTLQEKRAGYGKQIVASLAQQLTIRFGPVFDHTNLSRMMRFAELYPQFDNAASLAHQLSWTHIRELLTVEPPEARDFYASQAASKHLGVRDLRQAIARRAYERRQIANAQLSEGSAVPRDTFTDPMILDLLGLHDTYSERDLEGAILRDMKDFLMEVGDGFTFVASQKRMPVSDRTSYRLDLLFFSRSLSRLVAVELKLGPFAAEYEGQMRGYLKWLDRHDRKDGEGSPLGLILCTGSDREEIELLELHKDGIMVVEYWTVLPPKAELEAKLREIVRNAQERLARREIAATGQGQNEL